MSEEIKPALTAEEWRLGVKSSSENLEAQQLRSVFITREASVSLTVVAPWGGDSERITVGEDMRHALAALALYGQPFGFTREDVEILRQMPTYIRGLGLGGHPDGAARFIAGLAARIAALLPKEE